MECNVETYETVMHRFAGKQDLFKRMLLKFRPEVEGLIGEIQTAVNTDGFLDLARAFHSIKGVSATMGAITLSVYTAELEKSCKEASPEEIVNLVPKDIVETLTYLLNESEKALTDLK